MSYDSNYYYYYCNRIMDFHQSFLLLVLPKYNYKCHTILLPIPTIITDNNYNNTAVRMT